MKVSRRGQVTIPFELREQLGLHPGAEVDFELEGDVARIVPVKKAHLLGRSALEHMRGRGTIRLTTDEIMAMTRGKE